MPFVVLAIASGAIFGIADQQLARFERLAATDIASRLNGPAKKVSVKVVPNGLAAAWGELESATITARDFSIDGLPLFTEPQRRKSGRIGTLSLRLQEFDLRGLRVAELNADIPGCRYDFGLAKNQKQLRLSRSGTGLGSVRIREDDLARYIVKKFPEIKECRVRARFGVLMVEGFGEFLVARTPFEVVATLAAVDGTQLSLTKPRISFDWVRADAFSADALLKTLNPVIDLREDLKLFDAVWVTRIEARDGYLTAWGRTKIPDLPADNQE